MYFEYFQNPVKGDTQPATLDDLGGYWALISIELNGVKRLFAEVDELRRNGWQKASTSTNEQLSPQFVFFYIYLFLLLFSFLCVSVRTKL